MERQGFFTALPHGKKILKHLMQNVGNMCLLEKEGIIFLTIGGICRKNIPRNLRANYMSHLLAKNIRIAPKCAAVLGNM